MSEKTRVPDRIILARYGMADATAVPLGRGLINRTFLVEDASGQRRVLQALNPVFPAIINEDIDQVTAHLAARGLRTPRLVRTLDGTAWAESGDEVWRMLTFIPGVTLDVLQNAGHARSAGALLGRFHDTLEDFEYPFSNPRLGVHDTARHIATLRNALDECRSHPDYGLIRPLAEQILAMAEALPELGTLPDRTVHGDPKINNLLFDPDSMDAICLVDLDTLGRMPLPLELGDALRSWCNPAGEDATETHFSLEIFAAVIDGYAGNIGAWLTDAEWRAFVPATGLIQVELAARFCADALNESYFGWDPARYATRSEHNRVRARGQLVAHRAFLDQSERLTEVTAAAFRH